MWLLAGLEIAMRDSDEEKQLSEGEGITVYHTAMFLTALVL